MWTTPEDEDQYNGDDFDEVQKWFQNLAKAKQEWDALINTKCSWIDTENNDNLFEKG